MEEAKYLKRKIKSHNLDVHPTEQALVVNYDVEALILGELGDPMLGDHKECQKIIRLKSLNANTNVKLLAKEVIDKCPLIHESKLFEVEQLIYYLQNRKINNEGSGNASLLPRPVSSHLASPDNGDAERASISKIDTYIEMLYEEIVDKIKGSSLILQLARIPDNLQELSESESLLSLLARVLREDWKKSLELSINIIYIFFCFSTYTIFHNIISEYRIGSLCMDVIDYELHRYEQWREDLEKRKSHFETHTGMVLVSAANNENGDKKIRVDDIWISDSPLEVQLKSNSSDTPVQTMDKDEINSMKDDIEKSRKKFRNLTKKQEQLLKVAFYLLLNIAENVEVEKKMRKKNIIHMLLKTLNRSNTDLLILVVTFLKKLSIYRENKDIMAEENLVEMLPKLLNNSNLDLVSSTLKLLFNLSFDTDLRGKMVKLGLVPKLIKLLAQKEVKDKTTILGILYHASMDDQVKGVFSNNECFPVLMSMLLESSDEEMSSELIALCINLATNEKNADLLIKNNALKGLIIRAFKHQNALLMKIVRNISQHESTKECFVEFIGDFAMALTQSESQDFVLELIGIMGNLTLPDLDYSQILQRCNLIPWIRNNLVPGKAQDDLVLEIIIFLGTAATDDDCAQLICKADLVFLLIEILKTKHDDDEMVLQIIYVFYQISRHDVTRNYLIKETNNEVPGYLIDLMSDKNPAISKVCHACLDILATIDKDWSAKVKTEKFRAHNHKWLEMFETVNIDTLSFPIPVDEDDIFEAFSSGDLLKHTMLFPSGTSSLFNSEDGNSTPKTGSANVSVYNGEDGASSTKTPPGSRPLSRYRDPDLAEIDELIESTELSSEIDDFNHNSFKTKFSTPDNTAT